MKTGLKRNTSDAFYTKTDVARDCIDAFYQHVKPDDSDIILEPSAGSGSFSTQIEPVIALDINPQHPSILQQDFLKIHESPVYEKLSQETTPVHVIGNPPFGRQSSLAKSFIRIASAFASSISFILPKSFKKDSFQKTFPLHFHLIFQTDLPEGSFLIADEPHHVPCVFQIWVRKETPRDVAPTLEPEGFVFCRKEEGDLAIRRVGVYAGKLIENNLDQLSEQSHYFIRLVSMSRAQFKRRYKAHTLEHDNTVGPKSLSKQEILKCLL